MYVFKSALLSLAYICQLTPHNAFVMVCAVDLSHCTSTVGADVSSVLAPKTPSYKYSTYSTLLRKRLISMVTGISLELDWLTSL